ncbi:protein disulfide isomerase [Tribonema minus]|uniref:Protein disulfide-isomerase n=1 Tax=Tribonema minus TaxID=303371 RepID=A0A836CFW1_9STRA|nr:protein disulfide isomerase [Tribonema minus]
MTVTRFVMRAGAALLLVAAAMAEITKENGVLVLTDDNFDEALEANPNGLLVEMYAPWCGHCKALTPEYEAAAKELEPKGFSIAKLDATEHTQAAEKYEVQGFPTIKYIIGKGGKVLDYNGGRTSADIVSYVVKKSGPATIALDSKDAIDKFAEQADAVVVGFFSDAASAGATTFSGVATGMDDFSFGLVTDAAVAKAFGASDNSVVVLKKYDEGKAELSVTADTTGEEVTEFINVYSLRLFTRFSPESARSIFGGSVNVHALFFAKEVEGDLLATVTESATANRGKMLFVHIPPEEERVAEFFGIEEKDMPTMVIADMQQGIKKYLFEGTLDKASITSFISDFQAGNLKPSLKSEEPADEDLAKPVKVIKGKSFESIVVNSEASVFVEFYAPWCGHCKALEPKWDEVAQKLEGDKSVVIAKMDATANEVDHPGVDVQGFPTLLFFPAGDKSNPVTYEGEREVDFLLKFVKENAKSAAPDVKDEL